jgi:hypothetical protein
MRFFPSLALSFKSSKSRVVALPKVVVTIAYGDFVPHSAIGRWISFFAMRSWVSR